MTLRFNNRGIKSVKNSADVIRELLQENGGELPINDSSQPEEVYRLTQMSKKLFKRSVCTSQMWRGRDDREWH